MNPVPAPRRYVCDGGEGLLYGELPPRLAHQLPAWLGAARIPEGVELKAGRVYRVEDWVVKLVPAARGWRRLRRSPALRAAEMARYIQPIRAPRPLVALQQKRGPAVGSGLLISEFVEGGDLADVWGQATPVEALPAHLAATHARGVFHGDLHPRNLLWNGSEWVLLDLESLRHGLHRVFSRRLILGQWSRLYRNLRYAHTDIDARFLGLFRRYVTLAELRWDADAEWARILELAEREADRLGIPMPRPVSG